MSDFVARPANTETRHCSADQYEQLYARSLSHTDGFWLEQARRLDWTNAPSKAGEWSYDPVAIKWFISRLNVRTYT